MCEAISGIGSLVLVGAIGGSSLGLAADVVKNCMIRDDEGRLHWHTIPAFFFWFSFFCLWYVFAAPAYLLSRKQLMKRAQTAPRKRQLNEFVEHFCKCIFGGAAVGPTPSP